MTRHEADSSGTKSGQTAVQCGYVTGGAIQ